jgi:hypothetical protein
MMACLASLCVTRPAEHMAAVSELDHYSKIEDDDPFGGV